MNRPSLFAVCLLVALALHAAHAAVGWPLWGNNLNNNRHATNEKKITRANAHSLAVAWVYSAHGDVPATPTVRANKVYFTDVAGYVHCVHAHTGALLWKRYIPSITGAPGSFSRTSPAISKDGGRLVLGLRPTATVIAIDASNGDLLWARNISDHRYAWITQSPTIVDDSVYAGVSSNEEIPGPLEGSCCTFRGSVSRLALADGAEVWRAYTMRDNGGAQNLSSGGAVWGSMPAYDALTDSIYFATGNSYTLPQGVTECIVARENSTDPAHFPPCDLPGNMQNSIVSLDRKSGELAWSFKADDQAAWNAGCGIPAVGFPPVGDSCPDVRGEDFDFGQAPVLVWASVADKMTLLAIAGQKSGTVFAVKAGPSCHGRGELVWATRVCPGSLGGGMMWGSASDGTSVYVACANGLNTPFSLRTQNVTTSAGIWAALNVKDGRVLWETPDPAWSDPEAEAGVPRVLQGAVSLANGVLFGGSFASTGNMCAMDAATGQLLLNFKSNGTVVAGPSIVNGMVYWPSGYNINGASNAKVFAFALP